MPLSRYEFGGLVFNMTYDFSKLERNFCKSAEIYPGQPRILTILKENEGVTLSSLSGLCNIGMPSLSVSVRNMQKSGLIRKEGAGKRQRLYLTDTGRVKAQCFHEQIDSFYQDLLRDLGEQDAEEIYRAFQRFDEYIKHYNLRLAQNTPQR